MKLVRESIEGVTLLSASNSAPKLAGVPNYKPPKLSPRREQVNCFVRFNEGHALSTVAKFYEIDRPLLIAGRLSETVSVKSLRGLLYAVHKLTGVYVCVLRERLE